MQKHPNKEQGEELAYLSKHRDNCDGWADARTEESQRVNAGLVVRANYCLYGVPGTTPTTAVGSLKFQIVEMCIRADGE